MFGHFGGDDAQGKPVELELGLVGHSRCGLLRESQYQAGETLVCGEEQKKGWGRLTRMYMEVGQQHLREGIRLNARGLRKYWRSDT